MSVGGIATFPRLRPAMRSPVQLILSAKRRNFRHEDPNADEADAEFASVRRKVRMNHDDRCQACGFKTSLQDQYMQVHHLDDDHSNNSLENLTTLCVHCHAPFHCGFWGRSGEASIVFLPEIPQWVLSHICRLHMVADAFVQICEDESTGRMTGMNKNGAKSQAEIAGKARSARNMAESVQALFDEIKDREGQAETLLGTSDPAAVGEALTRIPEDRFKRREPVLDPFRLFVHGRHRVDGRDKFPEIARLWLGKNGPFFGTDPLLWATMLTGSSS